MRPLEWSVRSALWMRKHEEGKLEGLFPQQRQQTGMHGHTCTNPSAATCTLPLRMSQRQTYSPSCASVRKFC